MSDMRKDSASDVDEMTYSDDVSGVWSDENASEGENAIKQSYKQAPDEPAIKGKRLAVTNLDWDSISATDLLVLFTSFCSTLQVGSISRVRIYPSLFGIEQMKKDTLLGPPKELFSANKKSKKHKLSTSRNAQNKVDKEYMSDASY